MYSTKNYIINDIKNPLSIIVILSITLFTKIYIGIGLLLVFLLYDSWRANIITISNESLQIKFPYRLFSKYQEFSWDEIEQIFIKKYGNGGYGSLPYIDIYIKVGKEKYRKVRIPYSPSMKENEFGELALALRGKLSERLVISERQP